MFLEGCGNERPDQEGLLLKSLSCYLVDTQTLILSFLSPDKLPKKARSIMENGSVERILSSLSKNKPVLGRLRFRLRFDGSQMEVQFVLSRTFFIAVPVRSVHRYSLDCRSGSQERTWQIADY